MYWPTILFFVLTVSMKAQSVTIFTKDQTNPIEIFDKILDVEKNNHLIKKDQLNKDCKYHTISSWFSIFELLEFQNDWYRICKIWSLFQWKGHRSYRFHANPKFHIFKLSNLRVEHSKNLFESKGTFVELSPTHNFPRIWITLETPPDKRELFLFHYPCFFWNSTTGKEKWINMQFPVH